MNDFLRSKLEGGSQLTAQIITGEIEGITHHAVLFEVNGTLTPDLLAQDFLQQAFDHFDGNRLHIIFSLQNMKGANVINFVTKGRNIGKNYDVKQVLADERRGGIYLIINNRFNLAADLVNFLAVAFGGQRLAHVSTLNEAWQLIAARETDA